MPRRPPPAFAAWLRERRAARGSSAADLAARVGARPSAAHRRTVGGVAPLGPQVVALARGLAPDAADAWAALARDGATPLGGPAAPRPVRERPAPATRANRPFPRWLRAVLEARGRAAGQLARRMEVDHKTVHKRANGSYPPVGVCVQWLAEALDADPATIPELIDRADSKDSVSH